jgi:hypothetical protein
LIGAPTDISGKLKQNTIDFGSGKAVVSAALVAYRRDGRTRPYIQFTVTAKNANLQDRQDMMQTHWLQFTKIQRWDAAGVEDTGVEDTPSAFRMRTPLWVAMDSALGCFPGLVGPGLSVYSWYRGERGLYDITTPIYARYGGAYTLDTGHLDSPYYDETSYHQRTATSLTMYDTPNVPVSAKYPKARLTAQTYLVLRGQIIYSVQWKADFTRAGLFPKVDYTILSSGIPAALPKFPASLIIGYKDMGLKQPIVTPNPIKGVRPVKMPLPPGG